ncbi:hypothetical protein E3Q00_04430 [Wallemia mellicola]|nr:hypothetical protein E3Q00_04430 [Wallemia mellicola]
MSVLSKFIDEQNIRFQNIITEEFPVHYRARSPTLDVLEGKLLEIRTRISSYEGSVELHWAQVRIAVRNLAASGIQEISLRKAAVLMETLSSHLHPSSQRVTFTRNTRSEVIYYVNELRATRLIEDEAFFSSALPNKTLLVTPLNKHEVQQIWLDNSKRLSGFPLITFADTLIDLGQVHALEARYYCARYQMMKSMTKTQADNKTSKSLVKLNRLLMKDIIDQGTSDGLQFKHIEVDCRRTFKKGHWPSNEIMNEWVKAIIPEEHHHKIVNVFDDLNGVSREGGSMPQYLASRPWHTLHLFAGDDRLSRDVDSLETSYAILQNNGSTAVSLSTSPYHLRGMPAAYKELMDNNNGVGHLLSDPSLLSIHAKPLLFPRRITPSSKVSKIALDWSSQFMTVIKSICDQRTRHAAGGEIGSLEMDTEGEAIVIFDDDMIVDLDDSYFDDDIAGIASDINERISQSNKIKKIGGKSAFECLSKTTGIVEGDCDCSSCRDILTSRFGYITHSKLCICNIGKCAKAMQYIFDENPLLQECAVENCIHKQYANTPFCFLMHKANRSHYNDSMESGNASQCCVQSCEEQTSNDSPYCVLAHNKLNEQGFYEQNTDNSLCIYAGCDMKNIQIAPFCIESHFKQAKVYVSYVNPAACAVAGCKERANDGAPYCFRHGHHNYQWKRDQNIARGAFDKAEQIEPPNVPSENAQMPVLVTQTSVQHHMEPWLRKKELSLKQLCVRFQIATLEQQARVLTNTQFFLDIDSTKPMCSAEACYHHTNEDEPFCVLAHYAKLRPIRYNKRYSLEDPEVGTSARRRRKVSRRN